MSRTEATPVAILSLDRLSAISIKQRAVEMHTSEFWPPPSAAVAVRDEAFAMQVVE
jgi:hypothetical protein